MAGLIGLLAKVNDTLGSVFRLLSWTFLAAMTSFILLQVVMRYVFNNSLFWPEDVSLMMMIWVALAIAPLAYRHGGNVSLDIVSRFLPLRGFHCLSIVLHLLVVGLLVVLIQESVGMIERSQIRANSIPLPMKYVYAILPIGFGATVLVAVELILRNLVGVVRPDDPLSRSPADPVAGAGLPGGQESA
ncbi:MAG: TRAP transporter small permease subunit [Pseudomonadota bacterium]